jgi:membrane-associated phospholipid phosphatase
VPRVGADTHVSTLIPEPDSLKSHRRSLLYALALLGAMILVFATVGRHPGAPGTTTTWAPIGRFDASMSRGMERIRDAPLTWIAKVLNVVGGGVVTIPLRVLVAVYLLVRRRWRAFSAWILTWVLAEVLLTLTKAWVMRSRPPNPLVSTKGFSFPSGHAVAAAATAVALVLAFMPSGPRRRKWELFAVLFAFVMAMSRVYLGAHWFSDVVAGVLLGTGIALGSAALVTEIRDLLARKGSAPSGEPATPTAPSPAP